MRRGSLNAGSARGAANVFTMTPAGGARRHHHRNAVTYRSPGLAAPAAYPGLASKRILYAEGVVPNALCEFAESATRPYGQAPCRLMPLAYSDLATTGQTPTAPMHAIPEECQRSPTPSHRGSRLSAAQPPQRRSSRGIRLPETANHGHLRRGPHARWERPRTRSNEALSRRSSTAGQKANRIPP